MKALIVSGTWSDVPGEQRSSHFGTTMFGALDRASDWQIEMFNGGPFSQLEAILGKTPNYDIVFWWANVPDNSLSKVRDVKAVAPHVMLVTSKRNDGNKYSFMELVQRSLAIKANLTFEFKKHDGKLDIMVFDPLGCCWYKGDNLSVTEDDLGLAAKAVVQRLEYLTTITRQKTEKVDAPTGNGLFLFWYFDKFTQPMYQADFDVPAPVEQKFLNLVKEYAGRFHEILHPAAGVQRFLGNASCSPKFPPQVGRCSKGMPSFKMGQYIFVSRRNIDKQFIEADSFVPCFLDADTQKLFYCGEYKPSVDTPIQARLYAALPHIRYMIHSHCYLSEENDGLIVHTGKSIPCGAIEEVEEVLMSIRDTFENSPFDQTQYLINLKGHGSIAMASTVEKLEGLKYVGRALPEQMF